MKAAHWLGFGTESVRVIKTDDRGQMLTEDLESSIQEEKALGRFPLLVNATAGTTVLGAIDDLQVVSEVCKKNAVWMHVDVSVGRDLGSECRCTIAQQKTDNSSLSQTIVT